MILSTHFLFLTHERFTKRLKLNTHETHFNRNKCCWGDERTDVAPVLQKTMVHKSRGDMTVIIKLKYI